MPEPETTVSGQMDPTFVQLNERWNAHPNVPEPKVLVVGSDIVLSFFLNGLRFPEFKEYEQGFLRFVNCERYLLDGTNDEGWYLGQCRFSKFAPAWGEFYQVSGEPALLDAPPDWIPLGNCSKGQHYLFYFRDNTFECVAERCEVEPTATPLFQRVASGVR